LTSIRYTVSRLLFASQQPSHGCGAFISK